MCLTENEFNFQWHPASERYSTHVICFSQKDRSFKHGEYTFHHTLDLIEYVRFPQFEPVASELNKLYLTPLYLLVFQVVADQCIATVLTEPQPINNTKELSTTYSYKQGCQM